MTSPHKHPRERLPDTHDSVVHKTMIGKVSMYLIAGVFEDGTLGSIEIKVDDKAIRGWCICLGIFISIALQAGVPLETITKHLLFQKFDPKGYTHDKHIKFAHSIPDYVGRWLTREFGG